jgi:UPF0176 protein
MQLHNRINRQILRERLMQEPFNRVTLSFYRYFIIEDPQSYRDMLYIMWNELQCFGRIYVAREGINAQMSVPEHHFEDFKTKLYQTLGLEGIPLKIAVEDNGKSFYKLDVKVRVKIVADGLEDNAFDVTNVGKHLTAREFNEAMDDPNAVVVDLRNNYESEVGHFENAICPDVYTFRDELPVVADMLKGNENKKLLLYCTGGIRCEKASAYFKHLGFQDVNQLHGGIIDYVRQVKREGLQNRFLGKNFVFDERLGERISNVIISHCHQCGALSDRHTNCANEGCHSLFLQCEACAEKMEGCCSQACLELIHADPEIRKEYSRQQQARKGAVGFVKGKIVRWESI